MESSFCDFIKLCQIEDGGIERVGVMRSLSGSSGTRVNHLSSWISVRVKTIIAQSLNYKTEVIKSNIKYICRMYCRIRGGSPQANYTSYFKVYKTKP